MIPEELRRRYQAEGYWSGETLVARLTATCAASPDRVAIIDGGVRLTFSEAFDLIERVAGALAAEGLRPGDVVSWQLPNWWEAAVLHHAILRAGGIPNPLNPALRARELRQVLAEAAPMMLAVPETWRGFDHVALAKAMRDTVGTRYLIVRGAACTTIRFEDLIGSPSDPAAAPDADPGAIALLLYTSGTAGGAKGVQHSHQGLLAELASFGSIHGLTPEDRYLGAPPVAHIAGLVYGILAPFALGTSTVFLDRWDPARALELIARDRATYMTGPPTFLQTLAGDPGAAGTGGRSSFRLFSTGGASIPTEIVRRAGRTLGCVVKRAYGSTEMPTLTATTLEDDEAARLQTDGRAIGGAAMRIVRSDGTDAPPGEPGEIWARGPELFAGYRDASLDQAAFTADGWYRTGDLGAVDAAGLLRVTGRIADIIIRGGENINAKEIEDLLLEHPSVAEAAVVGLPDERLGERACAIVALRDGSSFGLEPMLEHLRSREIAAHKLPERLEIWPEALPKTDSGKIRKAELRAALLGRG